MAEIVLDRQDMEELATKLNRIDDALGEREKTLLLAVFALAGEALQARREEEVSGFGTLPVSELVVTTPANTPVPPLGDAVFAKSGAQKPYLQIKLDNVLVSSIS